ncbi:uncharacterized protein PpBr36_09636, partial [Pyricularia pennisetigena]|uniref:uncharacterized protein n=1 Tax=Pyricularia pennisetigena TaxID=1578925 RepID=UPI0011512715
AHENLDQEDPLSSGTRVERSVANHYYYYSHDEKDLPHWPKYQNDGPLASRTEKIPGLTWLCFSSPSPVCWPPSCGAMAGDMAMEPHSPTDADDNGPDIIVRMPSTACLCSCASAGRLTVYEHHSEVTGYIEDHLFGFGKVQPPRLSTDHVVPLHHFDNSDVLRRLMVGWAARFDAVLDPDALYQALEALIRRDGWRKMGGRLRLNSMGRLESHIPAEFTSSRPAVRFSPTVFDMAIDEHPLACKLPRATGDHASVQPGSPDMMKLFYPDGVPSGLDYYIYSDEPQLRLYVVSFNDATLVGMEAPHVLGDIMAHAGIVKGWVDILHGREAEVPRFEGFRTDPLGEVVKRAETSQIAGVLQDKILTGVWYVMFVVYFTLDIVLGPKMETRTLFFPASTVAKMREQALAELGRQGDGDDKPFVSNGDVLTAWISKMAAKPLAAKAPRQDLTILNAINLRPRLSSSLDPAAVYGQNMVVTYCGFTTLGEAVTTPLGVMAGEMRRSLVEQAGERELAAFAKMMWELGGDRPISTSVKAYLFCFSNWARARFYHIMDFSPAVVGNDSRARAAGHPPGKPVLFLSTTTGMTPLARYWFNITGNDLDGNHWAAAIVPRASIAAIEEGMRQL